MDIKIVLAIFRYAKNMQIYNVGPNIGEYLDGSHISVIVFLAWDDTIYDDFTLSCTMCLVLADFNQN